ncbi:MAG: ABC transporter permease [Eggerthellaceae bacterium]|nr:ABC transporter permease [Eggerthellaceae bacterium]
MLAAFAIIMSLVILYNLINISIIERIRKLAILKVLGFSNSELYNNLPREALFIYAFGIILGIILGSFILNLMINSVMQIQVMYV